MSLSTPIIYPSLPSSVSRPDVHDGRSDQSEQIKLLNELRKHQSSVYQLVFDFTTNGDAVVVPAWSAQLADKVTWLAIVEAVATSSAGDSAFWRRETLINRNSTLTIVSDANVSNHGTGGLGTYAISWTTDNLFAVLTLKDAVGKPGQWRIKLTIQSVLAS